MRRSCQLPSPEKVIIANGLRFDTQPATGSAAKSAGPINLSPRLKRKTCSHDHSWRIPMKVTGPGRSAGPSAATGGARPAATGGAGFSPAAPVSSASHASGPAGVGSVDALIALQETSGPLERRRRAAQRASRILDVLDEMKLALLGAMTRPDALDRLQRLVREERAATEDPGMEGVLDEIDVRAAVELAKQEMSRAAA